MNKTKTKTVAEIGAKGGKAVLKKYGKGHMSKLGKLSAKKRWPTKKAEK